VLNRQAEKDKAENDYTQQLQAEADFKVKSVELDSAANDLNDPDKLAEHKARYDAVRQAAALHIADPKQREQWLLKNEPAVANSRGRASTARSRGSTSTTTSPASTPTFTT
jgi:uncharacterized membrane protein